ncbi:MAG: hypothetical protein K9H16_00565 [Bacteroidales bacterium]|nr:hypothetical protein [Bacteroidales bacterium]
MKIDLKANEMVVKATDSSLLLNTSEKIAGKLIITNQRVYFIGINGNAGKHDLEIEPKCIRDVLYFNQGIFSRNGLNLVTSEGNELKFTLKQRNKFGEMIAGMC